VQGKVIKIPARRTAAGRGVSYDGFPAAITMLGLAMIYDSYSKTAPEMG
jgi:hypothetical protein